jgi:seryl-tRNA synthetase
MLDLKYLRDNLDEAERRLSTRGAAVSLSAFRNLDRRRRDLLGESESLKAEKNRVSAVIGQTRDKSQVALYGKQGLHDGDRATPQVRGRSFSS